MEADNTAAGTLAFAHKDEIEAHYTIHNSRQTSLGTSFEGIRYWQNHCSMTCGQNDSFGFTRVKERGGGAENEASGQCCDTHPLP